MFLRDFSRTPATPILTNTALQSGLRGLTAATLVETPQGWCPAADLAPGRTVMTLDGGAAPIQSLDRHLLPAGTLLLHLPGGCLDNCADALILPGQMLLTDTLDLTDAPYGLMAGAALDGFCGARLIRSLTRTEVITLTFAQEEAVWANSGLLMHCGPRQDAAPFFPRLPHAAIRALLARRAPPSAA